MDGNLPGDFLDDVTDESGALAQVALGAGDTGLDDTSGGLLYFRNNHDRSASIFCK